MSSVWACVYTRHKTKKAKTWRDGILKVSIDKVETLMLYYFIKTYFK
jgi:hypothetical protein